MQKRMSRVGCGIVLLVGLCLAGTMPAVAADESSVDVNGPDAMKPLLEQQVGKRVKIKFCSGQDVEGKVVKVGSHVVQLTELVDATVKLNDVAAVIVRVRSKS
ncbi:MAG: hypothetical protein JSS38_19720 [Nitrospira sp.]|nr:hypothetical protein [Nitrospira sp.]MBS0156819.1 hypothetical protein [Nitrospira sp.]MBS0166868.1 hypothetical protein [Nitrospira sp.]